MMTLSGIRWIGILFVGVMLTSGGATVFGEDAGVPNWIKMPLLSPEQKAGGIFPGGEGAQWPRGPVAVSPADPKFLLLPIDVGGLYRSLDGGAHWESAMVGWNARGANGFAIDPKNETRVIGIAANSSDWGAKTSPSPLGLYLSTNKASSWRQVLDLNGAFGGTVVFDPNSYDSTRGFCVIAYYFSGEQQFFRSDDGGATWQRIRSAAQPGLHTGGSWDQGYQTRPHLQLDARNGRVYLGGEHGLFCTVDHGNSWSCIRTQSVYSLALAADGTIYISDPGKLYDSTDGGKTWISVPAAGLDIAGGRRIQDLVISPVDSKRMLCWTSGKYFNWDRYFSIDRGLHWQKTKVNRDSAPLALNHREGYATWSPDSADTAWEIGGDWVVKSTDGGATFHWSNNGYNGIMLGGLFNFSAQSPDVVFLGFQDYNGAFTADGGLTWNCRDVSGKGWGGMEYGAFALNARVMWAGDAESWGSPRRLRVSLDGGKTWGFVKGMDGQPLEWHGPDVSCGDPGDTQVGFAANYRTADAGQTWQAMADCDAVFTATPDGRMLYGVKGKSVVQSENHGRDWTVVAAVRGGATDLAIDQASGVVYAASEDRLKAWRNGVWEVIETPSDQYGNQCVTTVAVDLQVPSIVYVGGPRNTYTSQATVCRSTDGGKTWKNLTVNSALNDAIHDGPHEVSAIRVQPRTREAWVAGECFGLWRIAPPNAIETGLPADQASAPLATKLPKGG